MYAEQTVNIISREHKANPFPFYAYLRAEMPVYHTGVPKHPSIWLVSRYDDVMAALKDPRLVKDRRNARSDEQMAREPWMPGVLKALEYNMLDLDDPDHARLRNLIHKAFTPRLVEQMRGDIEQLANELIDTAVANGHMDLLHDYALPLPLTIIARLMGVPTEDTPKFHKWINYAIQANNNWQQLLAMPRMIALVRYMQRLIEARRVDPRDDLTTALVQAEEAGDRLDGNELVAMLILLLVAGHETTVNLIASGTLALLENPDQLAMLRDDPALAKTAVEELLRYVSPVETATERYASEDLTIAGVMIPQGEMVLAGLASANRDEHYFEMPDVLDITRSPNPHLSFGHGIHYCAGAPLARMEGQIAFNVLLERLPNLQLAVPTDQLRWRPTFALRGLEALPVQWS